MSHLYDGYKVFTWPEFHALMEKLEVEIGIIPKQVRVDGMLRGVEIKMEVDDPVEVKIVRLKNRPGEPRQDETFTYSSLTLTGFALYREQVFIDFCNRLGFLWGLHTVSCSFRIFEGEVVKVTHVYVPESLPLPEIADTPVLTRSEGS